MNPTRHLRTAWALGARHGLGLAAAGVLLALAVWAFAEVKNADVCGPPVAAKPAQASGAEGMPPLPLPAVPQRRTEKKNPPTPPVIVAKIKTGSLADWATDPNDINNLLIWMKANLQVAFSYEAKPLEQIDLSPGGVPVLYRTGHNAFSFAPQERSAIRGFLLRGGMIIFDSCCGRKEFADSARAEIKAILPEHALKPIPMDHAIFNCYYENAGHVRFTPVSNLPTGASGIEGVEIACRMAVVFSPHDLSCGWDMHTHNTAGGSWIQSDDALKIGANLMAYATATRDMSVSAAEAKAYKDAEPTKADKFRVGQLVHEGDWNPDPVGLRNLLDTVGQTTALKISFATDPVQADPKDLASHPFLYVTGHDDFKWSDAQVAALKRYLENGGFILADACCGRQTFDLAFRREMGKVLRSDKNPKGDLALLPPTHPLYRIQNQISKVSLTEAAQFRAKGQVTDAPRLEGAQVNGRLAVVYSPLALNVGWRLKNIPYAMGYSQKSALDLGVNVVMYAISQ